VSRCHAPTYGWSCDSALCIRSALPPLPDLSGVNRQFRFVPLADICSATNSAKILPSSAKTSSVDYNVTRSRLDELSHAESSYHSWALAGAANASAWGGPLGPGGPRSQYRRPEAITDEGSRSTQTKCAKEDLPGRASNLAAIEPPLVLAFCPEGREHPLPPWPPIGRVR
jgi:hypothetical protein